MSSVKDCEKKRGTAEIILQCKIRQLWKECGRDKPNVRSVVKRVTSLEKALDNLLRSHGAYLMKVNAQLEELRFAQFIDRWVAAAREVKAVAVDVIGVVDEERVPNFQQVTESLKEDRNWMAWVIETRLVAYKEYVQTVLSREQYEELKVGVEKLTDMLSIQLKEACTILEKALPQ